MRTCKCSLILQSALIIVLLVILFLPNCSFNRPSPHTSPQFTIDEHDFEILKVYFSFLSYSPIIYDFELVSWLLQRGGSNIINEFANFERFQDIGLISTDIEIAAITDIYLDSIIVIFDSDSSLAGTIKFMNIRPDLGDSARYAKNSIEIDLDSGTIERERIAYKGMVNRATIKSESDLLQKYKINYLNLGYEVESYYSNPWKDSRILSWKINSGSIFLLADYTYEQGLSPSDSLESPDSTNTDMISARAIAKAYFSMNTGDTIRSPMYDSLEILYEHKNNNWQPKMCSMPLGDLFKRTE